MPRRKSFEETVLPEKSSEDRRAALDSAIKHAARMKEAGLIGHGELADLIQACIAEHVDALSPDEFDGLTVEQFNKMQELAGYSDDEDFDEADPRRAAIVAKVFAHLMLEAVDSGLLTPETALKELVDISRCRMAPRLTRSERRWICGSKFMTARGCGWRVSPSSVTRMLMKGLIG
jgi:hypothetical protein